MCSRYLFAPQNISRFIEMSHFSRSPEREISQMTTQPRYSMKRARSKEGVDVEDRSYGEGTVSMDEMELNSRAATAYLLQCGSPLYDPVSGVWLCWNNHSMQTIDLNTYGSAEGICCDFCGFTHWLDQPQSHRLTKNKEWSPKGLKVEDNVNKVIPAFYHCDSCGMDLCAGCALDVKNDGRYHVPCMQCRHCGLFMRDNEAMLHRCQAKRVNATTASSKTPLATKGAASSITEATRLESSIGAGSREGSPVCSVAHTSLPLPVPLKQGCVVSLRSSADLVWEVCVTCKTTADELRARFNAESMSLKEFPTLWGRGYLVFCMQTRLAAEEFARVMRDSGISATLRRRPP
ncbi:hypothetical protein TRVL_02095 [Trypanosoma vivax]|nr:hypothetical protein TRVL_02095 [Trypanosoma vivax]